MELRSNLNLVKNQIINVVLHLLGSAPASPTEGQVYHNTTDHHPYYHNGTTFKDLTDAEKLGGQTSAFHLDRANHTGTQAASTISDFNTAVRTNRLDQMAAPTASVSMNSQKVTDLSNGTDPADAVNFAQLEAARQGIRSKAAVEAAATGNVTVSNPGTAVFDGVTVANGERLLLPAQTTDSENGIYVFNGSGAALTRADDADAFAELDAGTEVFVQGGTANGGKIFRQITELSAFSGQVWSVVGTGTTYTAGNGLTESPAGTFNVGAGTGIASNANDVAIDTGVVARMFTTLIGDGAASSFTIAAGTHGLGAGRKKTVQVFDDGTGDQVWPDVNIEADGDVVIGFGLPTPTNNQYRVNMSGIV